VHNVPSAFIRSELEGRSFLHRCTFHKIDAVDNAFSCDLLDSGHRFSIWCGLRSEQIVFFESHSLPSGSMLPTVELKRKHVLQISSTDSLRLAHNNQLPVANRTSRSNSSKAITTTNRQITCPD
jgi:hypothetical protein